VIIDHKDWDFSEKGRSDVARHREKIDHHIRENIKGVIAEESIITSKRGKKVRIPIKGLKDWRFKYSIQNNGGGIGQGDGKPGDILRRKNRQSGSNAGNSEDDQYIETEVDIDYLIDIMFQDLGLPYIDEKTKIQNLVPKGWKFESISKVGIQPRMHPQRTMIETVKRTMQYVGEIIEETKCSEDDAHRALIQTKGDLDESIKIIKAGKLDPSIEKGSVYIEEEDVRYKQIEEDVELHSNAVVIAMCDTSGSMDIEKKYLARSLLFWMTEFLKKEYSNVDIKFITHTTTAEVVNEEEFFKQGKSGGTFCHTAFDLANYIIDTEYPVNEWNVYVIYISDGDDWDVNKTVKSIKDTLDRKINMLGYVEINTDLEIEEYSQGVLLKSLIDSFNFEVKEHQGTSFYINHQLHFLACEVSSRDHIYPALKHLLFKENR
jgi:uncharacterized protein